MLLNKYAEFISIIYILLFPYFAYFLDSKKPLNVTHLLVNTPYIKITSIFFK